MKTKILFPLLAVMLLIGFSACKLGGESNYSPRLMLLNPAKLNSDTTLMLGYNAEGNIKIDSLHVNDTVVITLVGEGFSNDLKNFTITVTEPADIEMLAPHDTIAKYFASESDFVNGKILFGNDIVWMSYPFQFVAKKAKDKVKLNFSLTSDAKEVNNTSSILVEFPIKPELQ